MKFGLEEIRNSAQTSKYIRVSKKPGLTKKAVTKYIILAKSKKRFRKILTIPIRINRPNFIQSDRFYSTGPGDDRSPAVLPGPPLLHARDDKRLRNG